ncbi:MAG TPA: serine hydrolase, partial [Terriglobales bacterium]|nr:serine hydrolase [Terriglobales bacterium]
MRKLLLVVLLFGFSANLVCETDSALQQKVQAMAEQHHGKVGLYAANLKTGETIAINADQVVPTASVIKLPILIETMEQI